MIHPGRTRGSLLLVALLVLVACGQQPPPPGTELDSDVARMSADPAQAAAVDDVVAAAEVLGLDLIARGGDATTVTSPASLQVALSMAAEGAEGQTLRELDSLIGAAGQDRSIAVNALTTTLRSLEGDPAVVQDDELPLRPMVHRANRLVLDDSLTVDPAFVDSLARYYGAPAATTDLAGGEGKQVLDAWVDEQTGGLVPESAIKPEPRLRLVLQDALVLAARWDEPFPAALTSPEPFTLPGGDVVQVDLMDPGKYRETAYADVEGWQAVRLPYSGRWLYADVILPPSGTAPTELTPGLMDELRQGLDAGQTRPVVLRMPVVDAESTLDLRPYLGDRAPSALEGGFGGITDESVFISQAMQQGVLVVDEEGTVAAVVTEIGLAESGSMEPPLELTVNRPYLVRIADGRTGWPLILAHIADPRGER